MASTSATVLVVDDEDMVREVVCTYLEREGYTTLPGVGRTPRRSSSHRSGPT